MQNCTAPPEVDAGVSKCSCQLCVCVAHAHVKCGRGRLHLGQILLEVLAGVADALLELGVAWVGTIAAYTSESNAQFDDVHIKYRLKRNVMMMEQRTASMRRTAESLNDVRNPHGTGASRGSWGST